MKLHVLFINKLYEYVTFTHFDNNKATARYFFSSDG